MLTPPGTTMLDKIMPIALAAFFGAYLLCLLQALKLVPKAADAPPPVCRRACCGGHATNEAAQSAKTGPATVKTSNP